jgi:hypothetical protein
MEHRSTPVCISRTKFLYSSLLESGQLATTALGAQVCQVKLRECSQL